MRALSIYHRRFTATEMIDASPSEDGTAMDVRVVTADGATTRSIADPDEAFAAMGCSAAGLDLAIRAGLITRKDDGTTAYAVRPPS